MEKELAKKFSIDIDFIKKKEDKINNLVAISDSTKIETDESFEIAKSNLKKMKEIAKSMDDERKTVTEPLRKVVTFVNTEAKHYTEKLSIAIDTMNSKIIGYSNIITAQRKTEEEAKLKAIKEKTKEKENVVNRYMRIRLKMYSFLIGGIWVDKDGTHKSNAGCHNKKEITTLHTNIRETFPKAEKFGHLAKQSQTLLAEFAADCAKLMAIITVPKSEEWDQEKIDREINALGISIAERSNTVAEELGSSLYKESKREQIELANQITSIGKGIRKQIKFNVTNLLDVEKEFLMIDEQKVKKFVHVYREKILESLRKNKQPLKGISFYVEEKMVNR